MVHHVESGSIGESQEIEKSDLLEAVDGAPVRDLEELYAKLQEASQTRRRLTMTFKKLTGGDTLFSYTQRVAVGFGAAHDRPAARHAERGSDDERSERSAGGQPGAVSDSRLAVSASGSLPRGLES